MTYPDLPGRPIAVVVDIPVSARVISELAERTGITLNGLTIIAPGADRAITVRPSVQRVPGDLVLSTMSLFDCVQWTSGQPAMVMLGLEVRLAAMYNRMSASQSRVTGNSTLSDVFLMVLGTLGMLFVIIEISALVMGLSLARSITTAVDSLVDGTERVQRGDFTHTISVAVARPARRTGAVVQPDDAQHRRAAGRVRGQAAARGGAAHRARHPDVAAAARARRHAGPRAGHALRARRARWAATTSTSSASTSTASALLVADVAGKGTSAALYMAELKGLLSSLSRTDALAEVAAVPGEPHPGRDARHAQLHHDVVRHHRHGGAHVHLGARRAHAAGAVHRQRRPSAAASRCTRRRASSSASSSRASRCASSRSSRSTRSRSCDGDVFVFYTDGVTEAMNATSDLFGDDRLVEVLSQSGSLCAATISQRIQDEVAAFVDGADPHDDMTMIVVRINGAGAPAGA